MSAQAEAPRPPERAAVGRQTARTAAGAGSAPSRVSSAAPCPAGEPTGPRIDWRRQDRQDTLARLDSLVLRQTQPEVWRAGILADVVPLAERWANAGGGDESEETIRALVDLYRATRGAFLPAMPAEALFYMLAACLHVEAHCGPNAPLHGKDYLGPLWDRLEAIRWRHGWPQDDEDGGPWCPEEHVDPLPANYVAWAEEFERAQPGMERASLRAVCERYGVPEIAEFKEADPAGFERRCQRGRQACQAMDE